MWFKPASVGGRRAGKVEQRAERSASQNAAGAERPDGDPQTEARRACGNPASCKLVTRARFWLSQRLATKPMPDHSEFVFREVLGIGRTNYGVQR